MYSNTNERPVAVGEWMVTMLLMSIPIVNLILLLVWAFSGNTAVSKCNWAKASLLWMLIGMVLYAAVFAAVFALGIATSVR